MDWQNVNTAAAATLWLRSGLSVCCWSPRDGSPFQHNHSSPAMLSSRELKRVGPMMNTWTHDKISKHTHGAQSAMLFPVLAHSWRSPSLCECLAACLISQPLALFGIFSDSTAFGLFVPLWLTCQSKLKWLLIFPLTPWCSDSFILAARDISVSVISVTPKYYERFS